MCCFGSDREGGRAPNPATTKTYLNTYLYRYLKAYICGRLERSRRGLEKGKEMRKGKVGQGGVEPNALLAADDTPTDRSDRVDMTLIVGGHPAEPLNYYGGSGVWALEV